MSKNILSKLGYCSLLLLSLVLMSCDPVSGGLPHHDITISISARAPDEVDSVSVCVSSDDEDYSCSKNFFVVCDNGYMAMDGAECGDEYYVKVKFYCSAGESYTEPYKASIKFLDKNKLVFWSYEERLLIDDYSAYKLVDFYPPSDTTCGKIVNYALMNIEE